MIIKPAKGISLPIAFNYNYRGKCYSEMDVYFSFKPIGIGHRDLIDSGTNHLKELKNLLKRGSGIFDALVPYKAEVIDRSGSLFGSYSSYKSAIGCVDENPTTATISERLGMMPCTQNNLNALLDSFKPAFYLQIKDDRMFLMILVDGKYCEIPSQSYSHRCSQGFGHKTIAIDGQGLAKSFDAINWQSLFKDINDSAIESADVSTEEVRLEGSVTKRLGPYVC